MKNDRNYPIVIGQFRRKPKSQIIVPGIVKIQ